MLLQKGNIGKGIAQPVQRRGVPSALRHAPLANKVATPAVAPQGLLRPILSERGSPALLKRQRALDVVVRAAETEQEAENAGTVVPGDGWESFPPPPYEPSEQVLDLWQQADAVCFDVDRTVTTDASVGLLAKFMGIEDEAQSLMEQANRGEINLTKAFEDRLAKLNFTPTDIDRFLEEHPAHTRLVPGVENLIAALKARGVEVFLISGGFREMALPIASHLKIPAKNVFCNTMSWQLDDHGEPVRLQGLDMTRAAESHFKSRAIERIRRKYPYNNIIMVGDGFSDLEAMQGSPDGADAFICFGGVMQRPAVASQADWFVRSYDELMAKLKRYKVTMVGSGAWACTAVRMVAQSTAEAAQLPGSVFEKEVTMWVHEEKHSGRNLIEYINENHENPIYLPGIDLGENVKATSDLIEAVRGADALIFCAPHQFMHGICKQLAAARVVGRGVKAISLTKGMRVRAEGPQLISQMVSRILGIDCSVLMGANIAGDIAKEELSEAVIAYANRESGSLWQQLFQRPYFAINLLADVPGAEMCGTLKNIVAVGAGIGDGLGVGPNSKASILRQGLSEMRKFCKFISPSVRDDTFFESCGVADLIASSYGGRNRRVAEAWAQKRIAGDDQVTFEKLEKEMLNGQKLQAVLTSDEVQEILHARGWELEFPSFTTINRIIHGEVPPTMILRYRVACSMPSMPPARRVVNDYY
uniref:Glycerol-3-phosphate dehydrogenase [NAD(+)] n=1 Tax=Dunaliella tertiolecta TaxID=3047 RepID=A0A0C5IM46_DUNTE|nr:glycerol-3-phosphate dehydrogenase [Dunaliella tertiolecta]